MPRLAIGLMLTTSTVAAFAAGQPNWLHTDKGCTTVPADKCGTSLSDSCLVCGTKSSFDCEKCCPGCTVTHKNGSVYSWCTCSGPPRPGPPPSGPDSWQTYEVAGMDVLAVTGGKDKDAYEKVVVLLHGGGLQGTSWEYNYDQGWFGNLTGLKYVFPTTVLPGHVWYSSYKNGCGLADDCAYNRSSIEDSAARVAALLQHEQALVGGDSKKTYLGGFSEGAQLTSYIQLAKLNYALGGAIVMDGFPLPPLFDLPGHPRVAAEKNLTYYGDDMAWMIWHGDADPIFPVKLTMSTYAAIFDLLGVADTVKVNHTEPGMTHTLIEPEFDAMVKFIRG